MIHKFCLFSHPYFLSYNVLLPLPRKITVPCTTTRFIPSEQHSFLLKISLLKIVCGLPVSPLQSTGSSTHLPLPTSHSHSRFLTPAETHLDFFSSSLWLFILFLLPRIVLQLPPAHSPFSQPIENVLIVLEAVLTLEALYPYEAFPNDSSRVDPCSCPDKKTFCYYVYCSIYLDSE